MNEKYNESVTEKTKKKILDVKGLIILISSLVLSVVFIVWGIVVLETENDYSGGGYNPSTNNSITLELNNTHYEDTTPYETVTFKFTPSSSGNYVIKINNGTLNLVKDSYGNQMSTYYSSSSYDTTKEVYLY